MDSQTIPASSLLSLVNGRTITPEPISPSGFRFFTFPVELRHMVYESLIPEEFYIRYGAANGPLEQLRCTSRQFSQDIEDWYQSRKSRKGLMRTRFGIINLSTSTLRYKSHLSTEAKPPSCELAKRVLRDTQYQNAVQHIIIDITRKTRRLYAALTEIDTTNLPAFKNLQSVRIVYDYPRKDEDDLQRHIWRNFWPWREDQFVNRPKLSYCHPDMVCTCCVLPELRATNLAKYPGGRRYDVIKFMSLDESDATRWMDGPFGEVTFWRDFEPWMQPVLE